MFDLRGYSLSDLLLFSPASYYRLIELYNLDLWPLQIAALMLGTVLVLLARPTGAVRGRLVAAALAAVWLWVAYAFHVERYATIQIAAPYYGALFAFQALLLLWTGVIRGRLQFALGDDPAGRIGLGIVTLGVLFFPLLCLLAGRSWSEVELFAFMPDPTVVATFGFLLMTAGRAYWVLLIVPILWSAVSGATAWAMGAYESLLTPLAAAITLVVAIWKAIR